MNMNEDEFASKCQFLSEAGFAPLSFYKQNSISNSQSCQSSSHYLNQENQTKSNYSNNNQNIRLEQDEEFEKALNNDKLKSEMERMNEFRDRQQTRIKSEEKEQNEETRSKNQQMALNIKNEGDVQIAFVFPSRKRILNRFYSSSLGSDLYCFISGQDEMYDEEGHIKTFTLLHGLNEKVEHDFLLSEQNISGRIVVNVIVE
jgi:ATPase subunit of ABC transporter with duplicated ATPase domains